MSKQNVPNIKWKELPEEHDYPAAKLLVRDSLHGKVVIADGYHRICSCYTVSSCT